MQKFPEIWIVGVAATTFDLNKLISSDKMDIVLMDKDLVCKFYPKLIQEDEKIIKSMHKFVLVGEESDHEAMDFIHYMNAKGYVPTTADGNFFRNTIVKEQKKLIVGKFLYSHTGKRKSRVLFCIMANGASIVRIIF